MSNTITDLPFVKDIPNGRCCFWHVETPDTINSDDAYSEGNITGNEYAAAYLQYIKNEGSYGNSLGWLLKDMPWEKYKDNGESSDSTYQKGVMVGFFSILEPFARLGAMVIDPDEYVEQEKSAIMSIIQNRKLEAIS